MKELVIKKCLKCNAIVKVIEDCNCGDCGIVCCGEPMKSLKANSTDGAVEKHVPEYTINGDSIDVVVNHVMENEKPGEEAKATFKYVPGMTLYSYCNKHLLWKVEVK